MKKYVVLFVLTVISLLPVRSFSQAPGCKEVHTGILYNYPKNLLERYVIERDDKWQKEVNLDNKDSLTWQITWKNDCSYSLKYVSGGKKLPAATMNLIQQHNLFTEIEKVTQDYYTYSVYLDNKGASPALVTDTMWFQEKAVLTNTELYRPYPTRTIPRKDHFGDTSTYAILYVYRPGKFTNSLANFHVSLDGTPLWLAHNNSGYIFKVFNEGRHTIESELMGDKAPAVLDIHFGKIYYVRAGIKWGFYHGHNFKLTMEPVKPEEGKTDFDLVEYR